jgi:hypothetical protein
MGRLCCGHGVYVSTGGSTTVLLWEDYVVVMVSIKELIKISYIYNHPLAHIISLQPALCENVREQHCQVIYEK